MAEPFRISWTVPPAIFPKMISPPVVQIPA